MAWKYHGKSGRLLKWSVVVNKNLTMKNDHMENSTKISFCFSGNDIPVEEITSVLELEPAIMRKKEEWNAENGFSCDEWIFEIKKIKEINCPDIEEVFREFIKILGQKTDIIKGICHKYMCRVSVIVVIHMENST